MLGCGHQVTQELQSLCGQLGTEKIDTCQVAARPRETGDQTKPDWVFTDGYDDRDRRGCRFGRERRSGTSARDDYVDPSTNEVGRQGRQPVELALRPAVFDRHVLPLDIAGILEALAKCAQPVRVRRCGLEKPDHRHRRLLRARRDWPRGCRAEQRDERAPPHHSITSSAATNSLSGTVRPSTRAVWWLMTSSILFDCTTGNSDGFAPLRMRPA